MCQKSEIFFPFRFSFKPENKQFSGHVCVLVKLPKAINFTRVENIEVLKVLVFIDVI